MPTPPPTVDTFDIADSLVTVGGIPITGFADGNDSIKISYAQKNATMKGGNDGGVTVVKSKMRMGSLTLTLRRGAASNSDLAKMAEAFRLGKSGQGYIDWHYESLNSATTAHCDKAFVEQMPDATDGSDGGNSVWVIQSPVLEYTPAGANG